MKNSTFKTSIFMEVQKTYGLEKLKLVKAIVTGLLSLGQVANRCYDRCNPRHVSLEEILDTVTIL